MRAASILAILVIFPLAVQLCFQQRMISSSQSGGWAVWAGAACKKGRHTDRGKKPLIFFISSAGLFRRSTIFVADCCNGHVQYNSSVHDVICMDAYDERMLHLCVGKYHINSYGYGLMKTGTITLHGERTSQSQERSPARGRKHGFDLTSLYTYAYDTHLLILRFFVISTRTLVLSYC